MKDYFGYQGKVCVITGAASGMAKAATEMLVDLGAEVYAMDWAEVTTPGIKAFIQTNLGQKESIDEAFKKIPDEIDKYFGIAGVSGQKTDHTTTFTIDFIANKYITEEYLLKRMKPEGAVAYITSEAGLRWEKPENMAEYKSVVETKSWDECLAALAALNQKDVPGPFAYSLAKRAMNYYVAYIIPAFAEKKVRVNAVLPAATKSGMTDEFAISTGGMENLVKYTGFAQRLAESREMAEPVVFINSNMASYISGVLLDVDFGLDIEMVAGLMGDWYNNKHLQ